MLAYASLAVIMAGTLGADTPATASTSAPTSRATTQPSLEYGRQLTRSGKYDDALKCFDALRKASADDEDATLAIALGSAWALELTGKHADALARLDEAAAHGEGDADWHVARGRSLEAMGKYDEALEAYRAALAGDDKHFEARFRCGRLYETLGDPTRAIRLYHFFDRLAHQRVPDLPEEMLWHARGFYRFSVLKRHPNLADRTRYVLRELLQPAYEIKDPTFWPARIASGRLLLSKYNLKEAAEDFKAALKINPNLPDARAGLAEIALSNWHFEACEKHIRAALKVNPNHVPSRNILTRLRLTTRKFTQAATEADRTLETNPNHLEALSLAAAAQLRLGDEAASKRYQDRVEKIHPNCALLHQTLGEWLGAGRQFPEAEAHYLKAVSLDLSWAEPRTQLGLMYMQWGEEAKARAMLDAAWQLDRFNHKTYNTRQLLKELDEFGRYETEHFVLKLDATKDAVLAPYFLDYLESIHPDLSRKYDFVPEKKTIVEVFPSHRAFSVRITSKPWIHTIGACTGPVIAMDAPRHGASMTGRFDWSRVLRHEFTHTVTLGVTRNRIPHWLTEALAVREERAPRSFRWLLVLSSAVRTNRLFGLDEIDWAFMRPKRPGDRELAYAQSEWMAEFLDATYGPEAIGKLLQSFREAETQSASLKAACGLQPEAFLDRFRNWAREQVQSWGLPVEAVSPVKELRQAVKENPDSAQAHAELAEALLLHGAMRQADAAARAALKLDGDNVKALTVRCTYLMEAWCATRGRPERQSLADRAKPLLEHLAKLHDDSLVANRYLALLKLNPEDPSAALPWLERLRRICPYDPIANRGFAAVYLATGKTEQAVRELTALADVDPDDVSRVLELARLCGRLGRPQRVAYWLERAVRIDPYDVDIHERLAAVSLQLGRTDKTIREYRALCELDPTNAQHFARLALQYKKDGQLEKARASAAKAVELDPQSPVKALIAE